MNTEKYNEIFGILCEFNCLDCIIILLFFPISFVGLVLFLIYITQYKKISLVVSDRILELKYCNCGKYCLENSSNYDLGCINQCYPNGVFYSSNLFPCADVKYIFTKDTNITSGEKCIKSYDDINGYYDVNNNINFIYSIYAPTYNHYYDIGYTKEFIYHYLNHKCYDTKDFFDFYYTPLILIFVGIFLMLLVISYSKYSDIKKIYLSNHNDINHNDIRRLSISSTETDIIY